MSGHKQNGGLDGIDYRILDVLRSDGRIPVALLANRVNVSRANAYSRLRRLEDAGVVAGFSARVDNRRLGLDVGVLIFVSVREPVRNKLHELIGDIAWIEYCAFISGQHDLVVIARGPDIHVVRDEVVWPLVNHPLVRTTETLFLLSEERHLPYVVPYRT